MQDLNDLYYFAKVVDAGGFAAAGRLLGIPKSRLSRRLAELEARLGARLLQRSTRKLSLTDIGEQYYRHCQTMLLAAEMADEAVASHASAPRGRLRVSCPVALAQSHLSPIINDFLAAYPQVQLDMLLTNRRVDLLAEGIDVAVRIGSLPDDAWLAARRLTVFSNGLYAAPDYLAERGEPAHPDELLRHQAVRLLGGQGEPLPWTLRHGDQVWEGLPPGRVNANSPELLLRLARAGGGIAAVPDLFALPMLQRGLLRRVLPDWCLPPHPAWAVFPGRKLMPAKTRVFIDMLQAALAGSTG